MSAWLVRAGRQGEFEERFIQKGQICLTWTEVQDNDLRNAKDAQALRQMLRAIKPDWLEGKIINHATQFAYFLIKMKRGDLVVMPRKGKGAVAIGEITGDHEHLHDAEYPFRHVRSVKWISTESPKSGFDSDLRTAFNGMTTIFPIKAVNADQRLRIQMGDGNHTTAGMGNIATDAIPSNDLGEGVDLEESARDQIAIAIEQRFKGHDLERLVEAVLKAQGYYTYRSPEGPDKGVDILGAPGPLGFGHPKLCVQVKSTGASVDHPTLSQLVGTMKRVNAEHGLLVSWNGFKTSVEKERAAQFFSVRLWDRDDLIKEILANYEHLDSAVRAELPLKRIWTIAGGETAE